MDVGVAYADQLAAMPDLTVGQMDAPVAAGSVAVVDAAMVLLANDRKLAN